MQPPWKKLHPLFQQPPHKVEVLSSFPFWKFGSSPPPPPPPPPQQRGGGGGGVYTVTVYTAFHQTKNLCFKILQNCLFLCSDRPAIFNSGFTNNIFQEKSFLWVFWNSWKFSRIRSMMRSFNQGSRITYYQESTSFWKNHSMHFSGDVQKNSCFESFRIFPEYFRIF